MGGNQYDAADEVRLQRNGKGAYVYLTAEMLVEAGIDVNVETLTATRVAFRNNRGRVLICVKEARA